MPRMPGVTLEPCGWSLGAMRWRDGLTGQGDSRQIGTQEGSVTMMRMWHAIVRALVVSIMVVSVGGAQPAPITGESSVSTAALPQIDSGDTAWVLMSAALVLLMTAPGLALFYAGMVRQKNALGTL